MGFQITVKKKVKVDIIDTYLHNKSKSTDFQYNSYVPVECSQSQSSIDMCKYTINQKMILLIENYGVLIDLASSRISFFFEQS
jgi:hypothetical protein